MLSLGGRDVALLTEARLELVCLRLAEQNSSLLLASTHHARRRRRLLLLLVVVVVVVMVMIMERAGEMMFAVGVTLVDVRVVVSVTRPPCNVRLRRLGPTNTCMRRK